LTANKQLQRRLGWAQEIKMKAGEQILLARRYLY
jgi:hypothetical protein